LFYFAFQPIIKLELLPKIQNRKEIMSSFRQSHFVVCKKPKSKPKIPQKTPRFLYFSSALAVCITSLTPLASVNSKAVECKDIQAVFARGSGEKAKTNINYQKFKDNLVGVLQSANKSYDFYDLGESNQYKYQYPAVSVENLGAIADTYIHAGKNDYFNNSVTTGIKEMQTLYQEITHRCPNTKFILGGYSQGAIVMTRAIRTLDPEKIIYLSTFGDPKLHLPEGEGKDKPCYHGIHSDYRINVPDCDVEHGILGAQKPYLPQGSLLTALAYPNEEQAFNRDEMIEVLKQVFLGHLQDRLEQEQDWARILSLGEQQRLAFARLLLHKPNVAFLDEATASMDEGLEDNMYRLLKERLPNTTVISVGHRSTLQAFHQQQLMILGNGKWQFTDRNLV